MQISIEQRNSYTEVLEIINSMLPQDKEKIPKKLIDAFEKNKNSDYNFYFDINAPLESQKIMPKTQLILAVIFRDYLASEVQKEKIKNYEKFQLKKLDDEAKQKYNYDNLFKSSSSVVNYNSGKIDNLTPITKTNSNNENINVNTYTNNTISNIKNDKNNIITSTSLTNISKPNIFKRIFNKIKSFFNNL